MHWARKETMAHHSTAAPTSRPPVLIIATSAASREKPIAITVSRSEFGAAEQSEKPTQTQQRVECRARNEQMR